MGTMNKWIRIGGWAILAVVVLWLLLQVFRIIFGIVAWFISLAISLLVLAFILGILYLVVRRITGRGRSRRTGGAQSRERDRIFE